MEIQSSEGLAKYRAFQSGKKNRNYKQKLKLLTV